MLTQDRDQTLRYNAATKIGVIAASTDSIVLDYWAARNGLMPVARAKGCKDLSSMNPDNSSLNPFSEVNHYRENYLNCTQRLWNNGLVRRAFRPVLLAAKYDVNRS
jgi:hypothetical protein